MCVCVCVCVQLQFEKGELITVTRIVDGGWWEGVCNDISGWFPGNYVELITGRYYNGNRVFVHNYIHVL